MATKNIRPQLNGNALSPGETLLLEILEHASTVTHVLLISLTAFIIWLCCKSPFSLMTWHVFLYTIGWTLLMTEATMFLLKENILSKRLKQPTKVLLHWVIQFLAVGLSIAGLVVVVVNKAGVNHFVSDHAISGLIATLLAIPTCANGVVALFSTQLKQWIIPNHNKLFHGFCGFATIVIGAYATITGYYTRWFGNRVNFNDNVVILCFVVTVIVTVWALIRPILNCFSRLKNMFN